MVDKLPYLLHMTGKARDHPWNQLKEESRLHAEAAREILHPDGKLHVFEYNGWQLRTKGGEFEVLPPGADSPKFTVSEYHGIKTIHPIKKFKTFNFHTGEWGDFHRCKKCRHLFTPGARQEIYCPECREKNKELLKIKRLVEKIRYWIDLGFPTDEINLRLTGIATCARCHKPFPAKRVDAKHCNRCRTAISREKK